MKYLYKIIGRGMLLIGIVFLATKLLMAWKPSNYFMVYENGWMYVAMLLPIIILISFLSIRKVALKAIQADCLMCPTMGCLFPLAQSLTAQCSNCSAAYPVSVGASTFMCGRCQQTFPTPEEFRCPECGRAFKPKQIRDYWSTYLYRTSTVLKLLRIAVPERLLPPRRFVVRH